MFDRRTTYIIRAEEMTEILPVALAIYKAYACDDRGGRGGGGFISCVSLFVDGVCRWSHWKCNENAASLGVQ